MSLVQVINVMICKLYCNKTKFLITRSPNCLFTLRKLQINALRVLLLPKQLFRGSRQCAPEVVLDEKCGIEFADGDLVVV